MQTGHQLCCLFAIILLHCHPAQPHVLWDLNKVNLCDDLRHRLITCGIPNPTDDDVFNYGLHLIELITIKSGGKCLSDIQDMYTPQQQWAAAIDNPILCEQLAYDAFEMAERVVPVIVISILSRQKHSIKSWTLSTITGGRSFSFSAQEVVERRGSATLSLLWFVPRARSPFVSLLPLSPPFSSMVVARPIHALKFPSPSMTPPRVISQRRIIWTVSSKRLKSSYRTKHLCSTVMAQKLSTR
jgi:hypothetical protein